MKQGLLNLMAAGPTLAISANAVATRSFLLGVAVTALLASSEVALSCGGGDEAPAWRWSLNHTRYRGPAESIEGDLGSISSLPFLSPGNDTRANLQFLLMDAQPWTPRAGTAGEEPSLRKASTLDAEMAEQFSMDDLSAAFQPPGGKSAFLDDDVQKATRCQSFDGGRQDFLAAVKAEPTLSEVEKAALTDARNQMKPTCDQGAELGAAPDPLAGVNGPSPVAKELVAYLTGAKSFYDGDFNAAIASFKTAARSSNAWVNEASTYMVARAMLNKAQTGAFPELDGVRRPQVADAASLGPVESAFAAYLDAYPKGRYWASARGLLRRAYWLAGDRNRLADEYSWQMRHIGEPEANLNGQDLIREIDTKYLDRVGEAGASPPHDPILLAVEDLRRMRELEDEEREAKEQREIFKKPDFPSADLDAQASDFAGHDALFGFLRAARAFYVDRDAAAALTLLGPEPSAAPNPPYLGYSREMLRGQALMADGRDADAIAHWRRMLQWPAQSWRREAAELGLATAWERVGTVDKAFLPGTRIDSWRLRTILLRYAAGPILLRMSVSDPDAHPEEKALARFVLLYKEGTRGLYQGFLKDFVPSDLRGDQVLKETMGMMAPSAFLWTGEKEPYSCPDLRSVVAELAVDAKSAHGLLCLGEFVRMAGLDAFESNRPEAGELGGGKSIFPGEAYSRGEAYKKLIADPRTPDRDRAYALYRAVNCYAPANINQCGGKSVPVSQRKAWFDELKSRYGSTPWSQSLKFFW